MAETPLGQVISVRSETDRKTIKNFGPHERRIRREWREFKTSQTQKTLDHSEWDKRIAGLQNALFSFCSG